MSKRLTRQFEFDVAVSFAGEDRSVAEAIVRAIEAKKRRVFYDRDNVAHLLGKDKAEYHRIYGPASRFVVPLLSAHYAEKDWPQFEFSIAKRESKNRDGEFLLPVKLDDTPILGIHDDLNYVSIDTYSPEEIAEAIVEKCRQHESSERARTSSRNGRPSAAEISLLQAETREALSLIASTTLPPPLVVFQKCFPKVNWTPIIKGLIRSGFVLATEHNRFMVTKVIVDAVRKDRSHWQALNDQWIEALKPFHHFVDLGASLSLHYLRADRIDDAVNVLSDAIDSGELGRWNDLYLSGLKALLGRRSLARLPPALRLKAYNSIALGLLHGQKPDEAVCWLEKLRDHSKRAQSDHWLGQAYLNLGIAYANQSKGDQAKRWYRKAEQHGRDTKDSVLVGRALGNLSQFLVRTSVKDAKAALEESMEFKRKAKDQDGLAVGRSQMAALLHMVGRDREAATQYRKAIKSLDLFGSPYNRVLARIHLAIVLGELGQKGRARTELRGAAKLARERRAEFLETLALGLEARMSHELGDWSAVESACKSLLACALATGDQENVICALHGRGIAERLQGRESQGLQTLTKALRAATLANDRHWMERCGVDITRPILQGVLGEPDPTQLRRRALQRQQQRKSVAAADLWVRLGNLLLHDHHDAKNALPAFRSAVICFSAEKEIDGAVLTLARIAECYERLRDYPASIAALEEGQALAEVNRERDLVAGAMNQRAILLQELGRMDDACSLLSKAVAIQRKLGDDAELQRLLHNLGEGQRRASRYDAALATLSEAETLARANDDVPSAIAAAHSKGLVLQHQGHNKLASKQFQSCRNEARAHRVWNEYVSAWEAMGNLAWCRRDRPLALKRYRRALAEARKHGCQNMATEVALNLANALYWIGRPKRARDLLLQYESELKTRVDSYIFHARLAEIYEECSQPEEAFNEWRKGENAAQAASNREYIAFCSRQLGSHLQLQGKFAEAKLSLERALENETDAENRAIVLNRLTDVLFELKSDRVGEVFDEANALAAKEDFQELRIELHMIVFDHCLTGDLSGKQQALRAWIVALLQTVLFGDPRVTSQVMVHGLSQLTTDGLAPTQSELVTLRTELIEWASKEFPNTSVATDFAKQQLSIVEELLPYVGKPRQLRRHLLDALERLSRQ